MTVDEALRVVDTESMVHRDTWPEVGHTLAREVRKLREENVALTGNIMDLDTARSAAREEGRRDSFLEAVQIATGHATNSGDAIASALRARVLDALAAFDKAVKRRTEWYAPAGEASDAA